MAYLEHAFEAVLAGEQDALQSQLSPYMDIKTAHREICRRLKEGIVESKDHGDFYRHYGHLLVDLGLFDDQRPKPNQPDDMRYANIYAKDIGYEFMHIDFLEREWLIDLIESEVSIDQQMLLEAYEDVCRAEKLERFLGIQFVGQKRFSLEGSEGLIPCLERIIREEVLRGYDDVVIGMPHRGRLNTMVNVLGVSVQALVDKFEGKKIQDVSGDVKYHLGHSIDRSYQQHNFHVSLAYNPSHLEAINPVVCGNVRARIDRGETKPFGILIHGDAAIAGQGVVMETLAFSQVKAYHIGGSFHIVVNNQIGFTTEPKDARSSVYCTDIAKMIQAPVFHVRSDDVCSILKVAKIAAMYRDRFKKDVFIDIIGYRKYGHNEADEPRATQPLMYAKIKSHPGVMATFKKDLIEKGIEEKDLQIIEQKVDDLIQKRERLIVCDTESKSARHKDWVALDQTAWDAQYQLKVSKKMLSDSMKQITTLPKDFQLQKQVQNLVETRQKMAKGELPLNWGMAELLAYQVLISKGHSVRLVGQDVIRGTFSHRMASVYDQTTGMQHCFIKEGKNSRFYNYNSILSEYAALGFEYGYAETRPNDLVILEAQFGDFINGAQIIIDQFISSGYQKWQRYCHLVMLLPHGYEGQGPEHSSARLERFLQLCAEDNIQVCIPTTPSQIYHLFLRQVIRSYRRPLVIFSPKSFLRHPKAVSDVQALEGQFEPCLGDENYAAERIVLCSGKVYYDLLEREDKKISIVRLEQLHPFPHRMLNKILSQYKKAKELLWVQEEPLNQGAWFYVKEWISEMDHPFKVGVVARDPSAAPAVGYASLHKKQQTELVNEVFEGKI